MHWPCVTDNSGITTYTAHGLRKEDEHTAPSPPVKYGPDLPFTATPVWHHGGYNSKRVSTNFEFFGWVGFGLATHHDADPGFFNGIFIIKEQERSQPFCGIMPRAGSGVVRIDPLRFLAG